MPTSVHGKTTNPNNERAEEAAGGKGPGYSAAGSSLAGSPTSDATDAENVCPWQKMEDARRRKLREDEDASYKLIRAIVEEQNAQASGKSRGGKEGGIDEKATACARATGQEDKDARDEKRGQRWKGEAASKKLALALERQEENAQSSGKTQGRGEGNTRDGQQWTTVEGRHQPSKKKGTNNKG